jgi:hypothetical protein
MVVRVQDITESYALYNGDCVEVMDEFPKGCIHLSIYSPPFAGLYQYTSDERDLSNNPDYESFLRHYEFVISELHRVTIPGRMSAVHIMDIPKSNTGKGDGLMDFPGDVIELHCKCRKANCKASEFMRRKGLCGHGWFEYAARYHVWKDALKVRNRTMAKGLAHQTVVEDASKCSVASADYLLIFRREGENPVPIEHPQGFLDYAGSRHPPADVLRYRNWTGKQTENRYSHWIWQQYANAFWDDVRIDRVLPFKESRDEEDEKHVHPLQLDVIERAVILWSNPKEKVLSPFMGVGSEVYGAVLNDRVGIGIELKPSYYNQAVKNVQEALKSQHVEVSLFAHVGIEI